MIPVPIKYETVQFADPKFETWMVLRYDRNEDGKIQVPEIPSELWFSEGDMFDEYDFEDCSIVYPENIDLINTVIISSCGNVKASQFKGMKGISSITCLNIGDYLLGVDNIEELLSCFPNVKKLRIAGEYHPGSGSSSELIENCNFLDKFNGITDLEIYYKPSEEDLEHILRHKDSLTNLTINGIFSNNNEILDYTKLGNLDNLKKLTIKNITIKNGVFINYLSKLEDLELDGVGFDETFVFSNPNLKNLFLAESRFGMFDGLSFGNLPCVENLSIISNLDCYGIVSCAEFNNKHIENMKNLKSINIRYYRIMDDLSFLSKLPNLEWIYLGHVELESTLSLPNMDNLNKLTGIDYNGGNLKDISNLKSLAKKDTFKKLYLQDQSSLKPNSKSNQPIFDILNDRKNYDKDVEYRVDGYWLKEFINEIVMTVKNIDTKSLGTIGLLKSYKKTKVESLITEENFPILETYDINVLSGGGAGRGFGENVGSKDKIQIVNSLGTVLQEYTVVVPGDVTGDGEVKLYDSFKILNDSVKKVEIDEIDTEIRDYNEDGKVSTYDALQYMKETIKGQ